MIENSVVSWPPCWLAVDVNAAPTLPFSAPAHPQAAGLVEECRHLRPDPAKPRAGADDDRVIMFEIGNRRDRRGLVGLEVCASGHFVRYGFGHALDIDAGASGARTFGDGVGHRFDMAIAGIVQDEDFAHETSP